MAKYIKREWKNGRWQYTYPEDTHRNVKRLSGNPDKRIGLSKLTNGGATISTGVREHSNYRAYLKRHSKNLSKKKGLFGGFRRDNAIEDEAYAYEKQHGVNNTPWNRQGVDWRKNKNAKASKRSRQQTDSRTSTKEGSRWGAGAVKARKSLNRLEFSTTGTHSMRRRSSSTKTGITGTAKEQKRVSAYGRYGNALARVKAKARKTANGIATRRTGNQNARTDSGSGSNRVWNAKRVGMAKRQTAAKGSAQLNRGSVNYMRNVLKDMDKYDAQKRATRNQRTIRNGRSKKRQHVSRMGY